MTEPWAEQVADYLRRRGLPEARSGPRGELYGLGDLRAVALPLGVAETVAADAELLASATGRTTPYAVVQPRPGYSVAEAYVTVSLEGLLRLLRAPDQGSATPRELADVMAVAVAAVTNYDVGTVMPLQEVVAGVDPVGVVAALSALYCALAGTMLPPDARGALLRHLGLVAAAWGEAT